MRVFTRYILFPVAEITPAMRTFIRNNLKNFGQNPSPLFKQDTEDTIVRYKLKTGEVYIILTFAVKPSQIPARYRDNAQLLDRIYTREEIRNFIHNSNLFDLERPLV